MKVLLMCICLTVVTANERCDGEGYFYSKEMDRCYKRHGAEDWYAAEKRCTNEGASLLVMETLKEANYIRSLGIIDDYYGYGYVGVHDRFNEGTFITIHGDLLDTLEFRAFNDREPNNFGWGKPENCLLITSHFKFNDIDCDRKFMFYCEKGAKKIEEDRPTVVQHRTITLQVPSDFTSPIIIMP